ncbi:MAG: D-aminoacylase [Gemmatimonadaceae bacterium]|nr:D-aminoacylase [Gemmatimonadaceae bacterium]
MTPSSSRPDRRAFVAALTAATAAACAPAIRGRRDRVDVVIRGGTVFDGLGGAGIEADVALHGGRVHAVGRALKVTGALEIDARGIAVAPGFVDIHSHADGSMFADPLMESVIRQGVTTAIVGQDGGSNAPRAKGAEGDDSDQATLGAWFDRVDQLRPSANVASMIGLGSVRGAVVGADDRPATAGEIIQMRAIVAQAFVDGACGASTGLEYTPGAFASRDELIAITTPAGPRRLPYSTHMRNEDDQLLESIDEAIAIARGAGCPLEIAHLKAQGPRNWPKLAAVYERLAAAQRSGMTVWFDVYPYVAYQTGLSNLFPLWSKDGGTTAFLGRLADPALRTRIQTDTLAKAELIGGWGNVQISSVSNADDKRFEGLRLDAVAKALGADGFDTALGLLVRNRGSVGMIGFAMSEENVVSELAHPLAAICSDGGAVAIAGPARRGSPHPRGLGTFPRVLGHYVRERKALPLADAIAKMTSVPASRVGLRDRGRLSVGSAGDVCVFDPATISDRATFADPFQYAVGVKAVFVNGVPTLLDRTQGARAGRALRVR